MNGRTACGVRRASWKPSARKIRRPGGFFLVLLLAILPVAAQAPGDLVARYRAAFLQRELTRFYEQYGARRPVAPLMRPVLQDTVLEASLRALDFEELPLVIEPLPEMLVVENVRRYGRLERLAFGMRFPDVAWSFLGSNYRTALDTALTWRLRGALEARYGMPTQTVVETEERLQQGTTFQFEYWLAVNDTIPLVVSDPNGPRGRGLILATDARYRSLLPVLREALFGGLATERPAPYADYFYDPELRAWYLTGYDRMGFVMRSIARPAFRTSGRPPIDALRRPEQRR